MCYEMYKRSISMGEGERLNVVDVYVYMCTSVIVSVSRYVCEHMNDS